MSDGLYTGVTKCMFWSVMSEKWWL